MRRLSVLATCCCAIVCMAAGASAQQKKTTAAAPSKSSAQKTAATKTAVRKTAPTKSAAAKGTASRRTSRTSVPRQLAPTSDRYREIQGALASKGYLSSPGTGVWDQQSMDAMKRFQQDQKLEPTGKLTAKSLTALGLSGKQPENGADPVSPMSSLNLLAGEPAPLH